MISNILAKHAKALGYKKINGKFGINLYSKGNDVDGFTQSFLLVGDKNPTKMPEISVGLINVNLANCMNESEGVPFVGPCGLHGWDSINTYLRKNSTEINEPNVVDAFLILEKNVYSCFNEAVKETQSSILKFRENVFFSFRDRSYDYRDAITGLYLHLILGNDVDDEKILAAENSLIVIGGDTRGFNYQLSFFKKYLEGRK